ncbi:TRM11 family SAM-dependent methyltransferase [Crossiella sp. CA198]|uniref:TRM11 family SAM-dependent methyltransferase n=1 Tax=Crossiella sp. CA198 TaxID=3455607 RepID=UPI003F8CFE5A
MARYALLILPAFNRVYGESAVRLTRTELAVFSETALHTEVADVAETEIGGVPYVTFESGALDEYDISVLSNLSSVYALFAVEGELLRPLRVSPLDKFSSDLLTIQKYSGKTNEHFTKLLLNITLLARAEPGELMEKKLAVFDPMCGRGTTLNQALMYGHDAFGMDLDGKDFDAYAHFLATWLKNHRIKHQHEVTPIRRDKALIGKRLSVKLGLTKELYKAGEANQLMVVNADTVRSREFFRAETVDAIVTDAPYGVQHGSRPTQKHLSRSPLELLYNAVPGWSQILRPGGAIGISWNTHVAGRDDLVKILADNGLQPLDDGPWREFEHRVDQSIIRDLVVARKPG